MSVIKKQTLMGTLYSYLGVGIGIISMAIIVPNFFTTEEYGLINLVSRWVQILVIVISLGFNAAGTRFFHQFRNNQLKHKGYLFNALAMLIVGSLVCWFFLYYAKGWIINSDGGDSVLFEKYYHLILPITISTGIFNIFDNYAKGLYDTVVGTFLSQLLQRLLVLIVVIFYVFEWISFNQFMVGWAVAMSLHAVFMIIHSYRLGNFSLYPNSFGWKADFKNEFIQFASFSVLTSLSTIVISSIDSIMVYKILGLGKSGIYNFCLLFGSVMTMAYNANAKAATPIVMDALEKNDLQRVGEIFKKSGLTQLMFGVILLVLVWISIDSVFSLVKPEYLLGKTALIIIGISKLYDLASGINAIILAYSRYYKYDSFLVISFIGVLYLLNHFMIPVWGLEGAAMATLIALVYYNTARNLLIWKFFKIHPYSLPQLKTLIVGIIILFLGLLLPSIEGSFVLSVLSIIYKSIVITLVFLGVFYKLKISQEINQLIDSLLAKLLKK